MLLTYECTHVLHANELDHRTTTIDIHRPDSPPISLGRQRRNKHTCTDARWGWGPSEESWRNLWNYYRSR